MKRLLEAIAVGFLMLVLATGVATRAEAQTFTVLHSFSGGSDGAIPAAGLVMDAAGNLYGTTVLGGAGTCTFSGGCGTVFKLDTAGNETVLHSFTNSSADGFAPYAALLIDKTGNLYGTTAGISTSGLGTVFKLDPSGNETLLHGFSGADGFEAGGVDAALIMDATGNLFGTTYFGGAYGHGTVFKLDTSGNETVLHSFSGADGDPAARLLMDTAGNLYSTTQTGGAGTCNFFLNFPGCGTVFKLDTSGNETVLHSFTGSDGALPSAGLVMDASGNFYGTTLNGGASSNCSRGCGTVFKLDTSGNETVLHSFSGADGAFPFAGLLMDAAGNLYGTTLSGGASSFGTVFKLDPAGNETILHSFIGGDDGATPEGTLVMDAAGNLYSTTFVGGASGFGTVFKLTAQTPQQATQGIINSVNALFSQGVINGGQDNSLLVQLQHAITMMNAGKNAGAIGNLESFISEVNDLLSSGVLSPSQATSLVSAAQSVIAALP